MFKKLLSSLDGLSGMALYIAVYALQIFFTFFPLYILDFSFWIGFILIVAVTSLGLIGNIIYVVLWIWAFFVALKMPLTPFVVVFFILFAFNAINLIQALFRALLEK